MAVRVRHDLWHFAFIDTPIFPPQPSVKSFWRYFRVFFKAVFMRKLNGWKCTYRVTIRVTDNNTQHKITTKSLYRFIIFSFFGMNNAPYVVWIKLKKSDSSLFKAKNSKYILKTLAQFIFLLHLYMSCASSSVIGCFCPAVCVSNAVLVWRLTSALQTLLQSAEWTQSTVTNTHGNTVCCTCAHRRWSTVNKLSSDSSESSPHVRAQICLLFPSVGSEGVPGDAAAITRSEGYHGEPL